MACNANNSSQSVRVDMSTRAPAGGGGGEKNSRGSGRVKDLKDSRDAARDRRRDNRDAKNVPLKDKDRDGRNGKDRDTSGGGGGDKREETGADDDEEEEARPHKEWIDVIHDKVLSATAARARTGKTQAATPLILFFFVFPRLAWHGGCQV